MLNKQTITIPHHNPRTDNISYHFMRREEVLDVEKVNLLSNQLSNTTKNRPFIVLGFDPHLNFILLRNNEYSVKDEVSGRFKFWNLTVTNEDMSTVSFYIFDHQIEPVVQPRVIIKSDQIGNWEKAEVLSNGDANQK